MSNLGTPGQAAGALPGMGITVYGCDADEAILFRDLAPRAGVICTTAAAPLSAANVDLAAGNRCISVDHKTPITESTLLALQQEGVRYICTRSIGCNHIDVDCAARIGITVENIAYSPDSVADYTLLLMLMALRNAKSVICRATAHDFRLHAVRGKELRDLTVGVIGTGRIGTAVMTRLRGFGARVLAHDMRLNTAARYVPLGELLQASDIVTLHTPLSAQTHHLLDRRGIDRMKPGALVVNTGRGALVDTDALIDALEAGRLGGAALDVLEGEDAFCYGDWRGRDIASTALLRLEQMPNVLISPHTAYYTDHALRDTVENTLANCLAFERECVAWTG